MSKSSKSQGSSEQRIVKDALVVLGGIVEAPNWSELRKLLGVSINTANLMATCKALRGTGELRCFIDEGNIKLVLVSEMSRLEAKANAKLALVG